MESYIERKDSDSDDCALPTKNERKGNEIDLSQRVARGTEQTPAKTEAIIRSLGKTKQ